MVVNYHKIDFDGDIQKIFERLVSTSIDEVKNNKEDIRFAWRNVYDNTLEIIGMNDIYRGYYSEEYRNCGNGHYYLLFDATHAIYYEDD